jgi:hypothetical protein
MLIGAWKKSGKKPAELVKHPAEPTSFPHLWRWLNEIPSPITWGELRAWAYFTGHHIQRWEATLLFQADRISRT